MVDWFELVGKLEKTIAICPLAVLAFGGYEEAAFVFQMRYWMRICEDQEERWVYKSAEELEQCFFLSYKQQVRVRARLTELEVLEEKYDRPDHVMFFRVNTTKFNELMEAADKQREQAPSKRAYAQTGRYYYPKREGGITPNGQVAPSKRAGRSISTQSTTENTTQSTHSEPVGEPLLKSTSPPNYAIFRTRFKHVTGIRAGSEKGLVALFENLASTYGEEAVLDVIAPWAEQVGKDWLKRNKNYAAKNFLEQDCEDFITSPKEKSKEDSYAHGLEKEKKWKDVDEKFPVRSEQ